jgi:acyl homoserine lactone synthase
MIACFDMSTAHLFGDVLPSQFRLRHRVFIERTQYDVPTWRGLEYDQYDTPAASYLVWRDDQHEVRGIARLTPTDRPYMLRDIWPDMVSDVSLPCSARIWEGTRFGVDKSLPAELRRRCIMELVLGYLEFGLEERIEQIIGVMPTLIFRAVFERSGWPVRYIGPARTLGGDKCIAGIVDVSAETLARVRAKTGITDCVIDRGDSLVHFQGHQDAA